jgi:hypothetical protein
MPQPIVFRIRSASGRVGWLTVLTALVLVGIVVFVIVVVALGALLILAPVMIVAGLIYYLFPGARFRSRRDQTPKAPEIIDGEYRVVEPFEDEHTPSPGDRPRLS